VLTQQVKVSSMGLMLPSCSFIFQPFLGTFELFSSHHKDLFPSIVESICNIYLLFYSFWDVLYKLIQAHLFLN
jgi:hypothetical protein